VHGHRSSVTHTATGFPWLFNQSTAFLSCDRELWPIILMLISIYRQRCTRPKITSFESHRPDTQTYLYTILITIPGPPKWSMWIWHNSSQLQYLQRNVRIDSQDVNWLVVFLASGGGGGGATTLDMLSVGSDVTVVEGGRTLEHRHISETVPFPYRT